MSSLHPACMFKIWIPRMLKVGKVGVKVSLKQPFSAGLMLQDLAYLALVRFWVQDKSRPREGRSQSVCLAPWCEVQPTLLHTYQIGNQLLQQQQARPQLGLFRMVKKLALLQHHLQPRHHSLAPAQSHPPPPSALTPEATRAGLLPLILAPAPTTPTSPCPLAGHLGEQPLDPALLPSPGPAPNKRAPPCPTSSIALTLATEGEAPGTYSRSCGSGYGTCAWHPKHCSECRPLLKRGRWEGGSMGGGKAIAGLYPRGQGGVTTTLPSLTPLPALGYHRLGAYGHLARPLTCSLVSLSAPHAQLGVRSIQKRNIKRYPNVCCYSAISL